MINHEHIPVLDLFAGPGGLGEGFARCRVGRRRPFSIALSVEMEHHAHRTLRLRSFYRQYDTSSPVPDAFYKVLRGEIEAEALEDYCPKTWALAEEESLCATLGEESGDYAVDQKIKALKKQAGDRELVLVGGPPCQAYSLVGRARNKGIENYSADKDHRHKLYLEYLRIIASTWPAVFVMENVKGILSSKLGSERIFPRILDDLHDPKKALNIKTRSSASQRYRLVPVVGIPGLFNHDQIDTKDYIVHCERFGIPQRRHRVFVVGLREDLTGTFEPIQPSDELSLFDVIGKMPRLRSGLSPRETNGEWNQSIQKGVTSSLISEVSGATTKKVGRLMRDTSVIIKQSKYTRGNEFVYDQINNLKQKEKNINEHN